MPFFYEKVKQLLLDCVFPVFCLGCKAEGSFLCQKCLTTIPGFEEQVCPWCYRPNVTGSPCQDCRRSDRFLDGVLAGSRFSERSLLQTAIHHFKYDFAEELAVPLGEFLFEKTFPFIPFFSGERLLFCPIPLHPKRQRWRGFNQSELLCQVLEKMFRNKGFNNPQSETLLERVHFSTPQMELMRKQRLVNVAGAFRLSPQISKKKFEKNSSVFLVDDIATTLATLNHAAGALKKAGFGRVYGLVLARVF